MAAATARKAVGMERRACADPKDCKQPELAVGRKKRLQEGAAATAGHGAGGGGHKAQAAAQSASHHRGGGHTGARDWLLVKRATEEESWQLWHLVNFIAFVLGLGRLAVRSGRWPPHLLLVFWVACTGSLCS
jgi:hypothetical protein